MTTIRELLDAELDNCFDELHDRGHDEYAARLLPLKSTLLVIMTGTHDAICIDPHPDLDPDTLLESLPCLKPAYDMITVLLLE